MLWIMEEPKIPPVQAPPVKSPEATGQAAKAASPLRYLVVGVVVGFVVVAGFLFVTNRPKTGGAPIAMRSPGTPAVATDVRNQGLSNMKQLSLAAMMYLSDHDEMFPLQDNWHTSVLPYLKSDAALSTMNPNGGTITYAFTSNHASSTALEYPAETVLFYDSLPWPDGKMLTAYADAHAKFVDREAFDQQLKMTAERVNKW